MRSPFENLLGHGAAIETLQRLLESDRVPQAMLLHGPAGVGKGTVAAAFTGFGGSPYDAARSGMTTVVAHSVEGIVRHQLGGGLVRSSVLDIGTTDLENHAASAAASERRFARPIGTP